MGLRPDDPTLPCLTLRMWVIGIFFCILGSGVNTLYTFRFPSVSLSQSAIQFLAYPIGKACEFLLPDWGITAFGHRISLNPGPFNYKVRAPLLSCQVAHYCANCPGPGEHAYLYSGEP